MMRLLRRWLSTAREMVWDRKPEESDKTERELDKSRRRSSKPKLSRRNPD